jgi:hypothetical protein
MPCRSRRKGSRPMEALADSPVSPVRTSWSWKRSYEGLMDAEACVIPLIEDLMIRIIHDETPGPVRGRGPTPQPLRGQNHRIVVCCPHHLMHTPFSRGAADTPEVLQSRVNNWALLASIGRWCKIRLERQGYAAVNDEVCQDFQDQYARVSEEFVAQHETLNQAVRSIDIAQSLSARMELKVFTDGFQEPREQAFEAYHAGLGHLTLRIASDDPRVLACNFSPIPPGGLS